MYTAVEFFAGSGLVTLGLKKYFKVIWANDIDTVKAEVYQNNIKNDSFLIGDISKIESSQIPDADLFWASFPCQDLSLAGKQKGLIGERSGLVREVLRVIQNKHNKPNIVVFENVFGFLTSHSGNDYKYVHEELDKLGYFSGSLVIDALLWVPQSRVRVFKIAVKKNIDIEDLTINEPLWCHPEKIQKLAKDSSGYIFWNLPRPHKGSISLSQVIEKDNNLDLEKSDHYISLISIEQKAQMYTFLKNNPQKVIAGYKRTRHGKQKLELRFDDIAGCLRTASGGSSKQIVLYSYFNKIFARYLRPREAARLMGAQDSFWLPANKNDAYSAMGDAVALPVTKYLARNLLSKIIER